MKKRNYPKGVIKRPNYGIGEYIKYALYQMAKERTILFFLKPRYMEIDALYQKVREHYDVSVEYLIKFINRADKDYDWRYNQNIKMLQRVW